jgi:hypothetical protein
MIHRDGKLKNLIHINGASKITYIRSRKGFGTGIPKTLNRIAKIG